MRTCVMTGSTGFVGGIVARHLREHGWMVRELRRLKKGERPSTNVIPFQLGEEPPAEGLAGASALLHFAYDFQASTWDGIERINVRGSIRVLEAAKRNGIKKIIAISSVSAYEGCQSMYGRAKLAVERYASTQGIVTLRLGLVYANPPGGIFKNLMNVVRTMPVVPLVGLGRQPFFLIHAHDLAGFIQAVMEDKVQPGAVPIRVAHWTPATFRRILETMAEAQGKKVLFVPVPWRLIWFGIKLLEAVGCKPRLRSDGLIGLVKTDPHPDFEPLKKTGVPIRPFTRQELL